VTLGTEGAACSRDADVQAAPVRRDCKSLPKPSLVSTFLLCLGAGPGHAVAKRSTRTSRYRAHRGGDREHGQERAARVREPPRPTVHASAEMAIPANAEVPQLGAQNPRATPTTSMTLRTKLQLRDLVDRWDEIDLGDLLETLETECC